VPDVSVDGDLTRSRPVLRHGSGRHDRRKRSRHRRDYGVGAVLCRRRTPAPWHTVGAFARRNAQNPPQYAPVAPPVTGCSFFVPSALTQVTTQTPEGTHELSHDVGCPGDTTR